jgi:hypothetical protein
VNTDDQGQIFKYIAVFSDYWKKGVDGWRIAEMRMDLNGYGPQRQEEFSKVWHFEPSLAVLTPTVHLPCIFPEIDNPYYRIPQEYEMLTETEKITECWYKFQYGIDWIHFMWVKETVADDFQNDNKRHFIARQKFLRQRFRYHCSGSVLEDIKMEGDMASGVSRTLVPEVKEQTVYFVKRNERWQILRIEGGDGNVQS